MAQGQGYLNTALADILGLQAQQVAAAVVLVLSASCLTYILEPYPHLLEAAHFEDSRDHGSVEVDPWEVMEESLAQPLVQLAVANALVVSDLASGVVAVVLAVFVGGL